MQLRGCGRQAGGRFVEDDGARVLFNQPNALEGLQEYFALGRYLSPAMRGLDLGAANQIFLSGQAAATVSSAIYSELPLEWIDRVGVCAPPGPSFVGGTHLVIWRHSRMERDAMRLIEHLIGLDSQQELAQSDLLPVRLRAVEVLKAGEHGRFVRCAEQCLLSGRAFPTVHLWDVIETRLVTALGAVWNEVLAVDKPDVMAILHRQLDPLAERLNLMLGA